MGEWAVVVPSNRPDRLAEFVDAWRPLFAKHDVTLHVVSDEEPWEGIPDFIPRRTDMIRSWGFYRAARGGATYIVSLDDDVRPGPNDLFNMYRAGFETPYPCSPYLNVGALTTLNVPMRGFPYRLRNRPVGIQYGGWHGTPDMDGLTQCELPPFLWEDHTFAETMMPVPKGAAVTCCIMNCAFRADLVEIMWQLPMLEGRYNRFGDIWSGLIQKRWLDAHSEVMLINGLASVQHDRASNPAENSRKERPGLPHNELMWEALAQTDGSFSGITNQMADYFADGDNEYAEHFEEARDRWSDLIASL